ncbi:MAG TPA: hypothetical protein VN112_23940, partial [Ensifer sp.]|nr:hypothetical protein [Ensifer sp.]
MSERSTKKENEQSEDTKTAREQKSCFAIMPISDHPSYPSGHFKEVYEYLIKPSAESAGYVCERADTTAASHMIHVEIISKVHGADLCICDLSSRNPNVLYELGIRQAFNKPTVLINDNRTDRVFDVEGFRYSQYNAELRPATLDSDRKALTKAIQDTVGSHGKDKQIFSLVTFLGLKAASLPESKITPQDARLELLERQISRLTDAVLSDRQVRFSPAPAKIPPLGISAGNEIWSNGLPTETVADVASGIVGLGIGSRIGFSK